jgi:hypothetical protein
MKDFLGTEIFVGDDCVIVRKTGISMIDFVKCKVTRLTAKTVFVQPYPKYGYTPSPTKAMPSKVISLRNMKN